VTPQRLEVFFVHLPKCGGTTVVDTLHHWFGEAAVRQLPPTTRLHQESLPQALDAPAAYGHIPYSVVGFIGGQPKIFSVVREPVSRTVSAYSYIRDKVDHRLHRDFVEEVHSIADFLRSARFSFHACNIQTRLLGASDSWSHRLLSNWATGVFSGDREPWLDLMDEPLDRCLERALYRISRPDFVLGLQDDLPGALDLLAYTLGKSRRTWVPRLNARADRRQNDAVALAPDEVEMVREFNQYDLELYNTAAGIRADGQLPG
jgi:hypothetical protein